MIIVPAGAVPFCLVECQRRQPGSSGGWGIHACIVQRRVGARVPNGASGGWFLYCLEGVCLNIVPAIVFFA